MTEPSVGASTCASGSHVWKGHIGIFTANDEKKAADRESVEAKKADTITIGLIKEREKEEQNYKKTKEELNSSFIESEPKDRIKKNEKHLQLREMEYFNTMSHTDFLIDQRAPQSIPWWLFPILLSVPKISVVVDKYTICCVRYDLPYKIVFLFAL